MTTIVGYLMQNPLYTFGQSAGAIEYTDFFSAERCHPSNECSGYDTKQSAGEVPVILELWEMQSSPSLPSLPGPFGPEVEVPDRVFSMGQISLNWIF